MSCEVCRAEAYAGRETGDPGDPHHVDGRSRATGGRIRSAGVAVAGRLARTEVHDRRDGATAIGTLVGSRHRDEHRRVAGVITEMTVNEGDVVNEGDSIAVIEPS